MSARRQRDDGAATAVLHLVREILRLNGRLLVAGEQLGASLSLARWQVLDAIDESPLSVAYVARNLGLARQSVQRTVDALAGEGLVEFSPNPHHRRAKLVNLTASGRSALARYRSAQQEWSATLSLGLSASELEIATRVLELLRARLET